MGRLKQAALLFESVLNRDPNDGWRATAYGNLALIHRKRGHLDEAERMHRNSLEIDEEIGWLEGMASQYANLGILQEQRGDITAARESWTRTRDLYQQIGMPHMIQKVQAQLDDLAAEDT